MMRIQRKKMWSKFDSYENPLKFKFFMKFNKNTTVVVGKKREQNIHIKRVRRPYPQRKAHAKQHQFA